MDNNTINYIKKISVNLFGGILSQEIEFEHGLNIIAGTNGTGKSELLNFILSNKTNSSLIKFNNDTLSKDIATFSPKRNAERTLAEQAQNIVRQDINAKTTAINTFLNKVLEQNTFQTIKSISEYLVLSTEDLVDNNEPKNEAVNKISKNYTEILQKLFNYNIEFSWNLTNKRYKFSIKKDSFSLQPSQLSSGENALISLIFAIYYAKESAQIYLIDEPEVHLNWQLEEKLFQFLDRFCQEYKKQIILVTHSRMCFVKPFIDKTQFMIWQDKKIVIIKKPNEDIRNFLAGDIVKIVSGITSEDKLIYVEDRVHLEILRKIMELKKLRVKINNIGNCENVKKISESFKPLNIKNVYFVIDNDNKTILPIDRTKYLNLIQLQKYCIENYFLRTSILDAIDKRPNKTKDVKTLINESIRNVQGPYFKVYKKLLDNNINIEDILDIIDASKFIEGLAVELGYPDKYSFFHAYLEELNKMNELDNVFNELNDLTNNVSTIYEYKN